MAPANDPTLSPFMQKVLGVTGNTGGPPAAPNPAPASTTTPVAQSPATSHGGRPPVEPPHIPGNGSGGGFKEWGRNNPGWALILGLAGALLAIVILFVINDFFTERQVTRLERLNRIPSAPIANQSTKAVPTVPAPSVSSKSVEQPARQSREQFVSARKQEMIDRCGRKTVTAIYKPEIGCFFFDNSASDVGKQITLMVRNTLRTIELDGEAPIKVSSANWQSCTVTLGDSCSSWIQQHSVRDTDGFVKFTLDVPPGAGFIANITN